MAYTDKPLKLPLYLGVILLVLSVLLGIYSIYVPYYGIPYHGIISAVFFVGALVLICQGINGAYLGKVHTQVKDRPIFIAKEILTYEDNQESDN